MPRYITLLRGINVGGNNKIAMPLLKEGFEALGLTEVVTYINSGNIVFSTEVDDCEKLSLQVKAMIQERFGLDIVVFTVLQETVQEVLTAAPAWWGSPDKAFYDNLVFLLPPLTYEAFADAVGAPNAELEEVHPHKDTVFWSYKRKDYQKSYWWKQTAKKPVKDQITIRTANTVRKIAQL